MDATLPSAPILFALLTLPGIVFMCLGLWDIWEERKLRKIGVSTNGIVIGALGARHGSKMYETEWGSTNTPETAGGYLLKVSYNAKGREFTVRTKQKFTRVPDEVEVIYDPQHPDEPMIDGFYKVGGQKYYQLIAGILIGIGPWIGYILY